MPRMKFFIDTHDQRSNTFPAGISKAQFQEFFREYEGASRDEGVVVLRAHVGLEAGRAYCFNLAPSAEHVRRAHARAGLPFDVITEVATATPGDLSFEPKPGGTCVLSLTATFNDEPYPAWVDAGPAGAEFVRVPGATFHRLVDGEAAFRRFAFTALSGRVFDLMRTLEELGSTRVEQRLARYLLRQPAPDGCVRITQSGIASELGTAREVVFRALRSLVDRRLVQTGRVRVRIVDRRGLAEVADAGSA